MGELEDIHFRESLKDRGEFRSYLKKFSDDPEYPDSVRDKAFLFFSLLEGQDYKSLSLSRNQSIRNALSDQLLDVVYSTATQLRQNLIAAEKGNSSFAHILAVVQENVRAVEKPEIQTPLEWENRADFTDYLTKIISERAYSAAVTEFATVLRKQLLKFPKLALKREKIPGKPSLYGKHFDVLTGLLVALRKELMEDMQGDSELSNALQIVHENVRNKG